MERRASITRKTLETDIHVDLNLDGKGISKILTGIGFFDHMLSTFAKHSLIDLTVTAQGDLHVDAHHTVEDVGYATGEALMQALGDKKGIVRFGYAFAPLDESLARVVIDLSGRSYCVYKANVSGMIGTFPAELTGEFFRALANQAKINIHIDILYGADLHHQIEAIFKAGAIALRNAMTVHPGIQGIPSTKGSL